jgi:hypothetical protein
MPVSVTKKSALEWLDKAYGDGAGFLMYLNVDPRFDVLRSEPRFDELLVRLHLKNGGERLTLPA